MKLDYFNLEGKVALVSGGATGIGFGMSEALAEAGATVAICSRRLEVCQKAADDISQTAGARLFPFRCDISNAQDVENVVRETTSKLGKIDILVNCAGIGGSEKPIVKMEEPDWDSVINVNLKGAYSLAREVAKGMIERKEGGRVINVASIGGLAGIPNMSAYCVSKAGLIQLTKVMALEWVRHNILVNALLPGYIETPMNTEFFASDAGQKVIKANVPMRRLGQVSEIKGLTILMASPASSFMTGASLVVDGGYTVG